MTTRNIILIAAFLLCQLHEIAGQIQLQWNAGDCTSPVMTEAGIENGKTKFLLEADGFTWTIAWSGTQWEYTFGQGGVVIGSPIATNSNTQDPPINGDWFVSGSATCGANGRALAVDPNAPPNTAPTLVASVTFPQVSEGADNVRFDPADISDSDAGDMQSLEVKTTGGVLVLDTSEGALTFEEGSNGTPLYTVKGSLIDINTALNGAEFFANDDASGTDAGKIELKANDGLADSNTLALTFDIIPVNDPPILAANIGYTIPNIAEDVIGQDNAGGLLSDLNIADNITDEDGSAVNAIVINRVDNTNGVWQFSTDAGTNWTNFTSELSDFQLVENSRLLDASLTGEEAHKIRFVPNPDFFGTASVLFQAWDKTQGQTGGTIRPVPGVNGGFSFSEVVDKIEVTVSQTHDDLIFTHSDEPAIFTEGGEPTPLIPGAQVQNPDGDEDWVGMTINIEVTENGSIRDSFDFDENILALSTIRFTSNSLLRQIQGTTTLANVSTSVSEDNAASLRFEFITPVTDQEVQNIIRAIAFENLNNHVQQTSREFTITISDEAGNKVSLNQSVTIKNVNDAPSIYTVGLNPTYVQAKPAVFLFREAAVIPGLEEDHQLIKSVSFEVSGVKDFEDGNEMLEIDGEVFSLIDANSGTTQTNGFSYSVTMDGDLFKVQVTKEASAEMYQNLLNEMAFLNSAEIPTSGGRIVEITAVQDNGGTALGGKDTSDISLSSTVSVILDTEGPKMVEAELLSETEIELTFDDVLNIESLIADDFTVRDGLLTPVTVSGYTDVTEGDKKLILTISEIETSSIVGDLYISFKSTTTVVRDQFGNEMSDDLTGIDIDFDDVAPEVTNIQRSGDVLMIEFSERVHPGDNVRQEFEVLSGDGSSIGIASVVDSQIRDEFLGLRFQWSRVPPVGGLTLKYVGSELMDLGGNSLESGTEVTIDTDQDAPFMMRASIREQNEITLTFNEGVKLTSFNPPGRDSYQTEVVSNLASDFKATDALGNVFVPSALSLRAAFNIRGSVETVLFSDIDQITLVFNDLSGAVGDLTITHTDENDEIVDYGGNRLATDEIGVVVSAISVNYLNTTNNQPEVTGKLLNPAAEVEVTIGEQTFTPETDNGIWTLTPDSPLENGIYDVIATATVQNQISSDQTTNELLVNVAPEITNIRLVDSYDSDVKSITYEVSFDQPVENISLDDFKVVTVDGTASAFKRFVSAPHGRSVTLQLGVIGTTGEDGTIRVDLSEEHDIQNTNGQKVSNLIEGETHKVSFPYRDTENLSFIWRDEDIPAESPFRANSGSLGLLIPGLSKVYGGSQRLNIQMTFDQPFSVLSFNTTDEVILNYEMSINFLDDRFNNLIQSTAIEAVVLSGSVHLIGGRQLVEGKVKNVYEGITFGAITVKSTNVGTVNTFALVFKLNLASAGILAALKAVMPEPTYPILFSGGEGSRDAPFLISGPGALQSMKYFPADTFRVANDIDLTETKDWYGGEGFLPIDQLNGRLDGAGFFLENLHLVRPEEDELAFVRQLGENGKIIDLGIRNARIEGSDYVAGIVAVNEGTLERSVFIGTVTGNDCVSGGLVAKNMGTISNTRTDATLMGGTESGGLVGINLGTITNSYAMGEVLGKRIAGALTAIENGTTTSSYWNPELSGQTSSASGESKSISELKEQATFLTWDFNEVWTIMEGVNQGHPILTFTEGMPDASNVKIIGSDDIGTELEGQYTFNDPNGDPEAGSVYQWYRSNDAAGTAKTEISGATSERYTLTESDEGKYISFEVTPRSSRKLGNSSESALKLIDNTPPVKPFITSISDDTGSSDSDGITRDKNIAISGTAEANATVEISSQFGPLRSTKANANGDWLLDVTDVTLIEVTTYLTAHAVDEAGNRSASSNTFILTPDFTAPIKPVITGISDYTGSSDSDGITRDKNITIRGTAEANAIVEVSSQFGPLRSAKANANGNWLLDVTDITLVEVTTHLVAHAVDLAGNRSVASDTFVLTPDFTAPSKPIIIGISDDTGISDSDGITRDKNITIRGTAEANATVEISSQFGPLRSTKASTNGNWLLDVTNITLVEVATHLTAHAVDRAGNRSMASDVFVLTPDFTAPAKPVITGISDDTGISDSDGITRDKNITISGTAEANAIVEVSSQFGPLRNTTADTNGDWMLDITDITLTEFTVSLTAQAVDEAGNRSATSDIFTLTPDFTFPGVTVDIEKSTSTGYTVNALFDEPVEGLTLGGITVTGGTKSDLVQNSPVSYSFFVGPSEGTVDVQVNATAARDIAGNDNTASNQLTLGLPSSTLGEDFTNLSELPKTGVVSLYPNPVSEVVTIDLSELHAEEVDISLYEAAGTSVFSRQGYKQKVLKLDVSSYRSGMYVIQLYDGHQVIRKKIMVKK